MSSAPFDGWPCTRVRHETGKIIWDFDTAREFPDVNGILAKGGSMAATGATVADGILYVNSGYSSMPGNVLLAFSAK